MITKQFSMAIVLSFTFVQFAHADRNDANKAINQAQTMIQAAERGGAQKHAAITLKSARDNLNNANVQLAEREWVDAEIAAKKAQRDAEVADAKSQALKAEMALADLQQAVDSLKNELNRKGEQL